MTHGEDRLDGQSRAAVAPADPRGARRQERRERFVRVATRRTRQILGRMRLLANCGNRSIYEYDDQDVEQIFKALEDELQQTRQSFKGRKKKPVEFELV